MPMKNETRDAILAGLVIGIVILVVGFVYFFGAPELSSSTRLSVAALQPGEGYTDSFTLTSSIPLDSDSTDGYYNALYCHWAIFDASDNVVVEGTPQTLVGDTCDIVISHTFAATGTYTQVASIAETNVQYDFTNDVWGSWSSFVSAAQDTKTVTVSAIQAPPGPPVINWTSFLLGLVGP